MTAYLSPPTPPWRLLVTGVGGAPGFDLARAALKLGHTVIAADADPQANGLFLDDVQAQVLPIATAQDYERELLRLCARLRPQALLSTVEAELPRLRALAPRLRELGVRTWLPPQDAVAASLDKALFHDRMSACSVPVPETWLPDQLHLAPENAELVVKPRCGQGARDVLFCSTRLQARVLCDLVADPIVQRRVHGEEFTADCLTDRGGTTSVVLRQRLLVKGGLSMVSRTVQDPEATRLVVRALTALGMTGACCVQGFRTARGGLLLTEVNARVAGGFPLAEAAGADLVGQMLNGLFGLQVDHRRLTYRVGVTLTKYIETLTVAGG
ncbi:MULTISPECIES: ATP-grasp domain-containing protein [Actinosynnema]|uniref:ATP-grasp domain-containing protein n=1 Tax=Actinosynnema TaxID=40566 RepID=UPI0020A2C0BE|nr:ATP-grasp domain-containing protein [Actinosynnema pretiosum]MCP2097430.1 carbamoyl-phosphate synthase large subunit [Actinosynnema pretiosum]